MLKITQKTILATGLAVAAFGTTAIGVPQINVSKAATVKVLYTGTTTDNLNVRASASTQGKLLKTLKKGSTVEVIGTSGDWLKIENGSGAAYVSGKYVQKTVIKPSAPAKVLYTGTTTDNLNVRATASAQGKLLRTLKKGSAVEVIGTSGGWLEIENGSGVGYVFAEYVQKTVIKPSAPAKVLYTGTTTDNLNVRATASAQGKLLKTLKKGSTVEVIGTSGGWLKIENGSGIAYVSAEYVKAGV